MDRGAWGATVHEVAGLDTTECTQHTQLCSHLTLLLAWNLDTLSADSPNRLPFPLLLPPPLLGLPLFMKRTGNTCENGQNPDTDNTKC